MIDWNWPIEFTDGTPAWVDYPIVGRVCVVWTSEKPHGVAMARGNAVYNKLVETDGSDGLIRNVELPHITFEDGTKPVGGRFAMPRTLILRHENGSEYGYDWPRLLSYPYSPRITIRNRRQMAEYEEKQARIAIETAAMEEDPLYGLF